MKLIYSTKPANKRPVWVIRPDGSAATRLEPLTYQMAIDGSRASWKPLP
jgi:TolB protein